MSKKIKDLIYKIDNNLIGNSLYYIEKMGKGRINGLIHTEKAPIFVNVTEYLFNDSVNGIFMNNCQIPHTMTMPMFQKLWNSMKEHCIKNNQYEIIDSPQIDEKVKEMNRDFTSYLCNLIDKMEYDAGDIFTPQYIIDDGFNVINSHFNPPIKKIVPNQYWHSMSIDYFNDTDVTQFYLILQDYHTKLYMRFDHNRKTKTYKFSLKDFPKYCNIPLDYYGFQYISIDNEKIGTKMNEKLLKNINDLYKYSDISIRRE